MEAALPAKNIMGIAIKQPTSNKGSKRSNTTTTIIQVLLFLAGAGGVDGTMGGGALDAMPGLGAKGITLGGLIASRTASSISAEVYPCCCRACLRLWREYWFLYCLT